MPTAPRIFHPSLAVLLIVACPAFADVVERFPSGLLARFEATEPPAERLDEETAARRFIEAHFGELDRAFEWRLERTYGDLSHGHRRYQLHYGGRPVAGHRLALHYRRDGWIQYASSSFRRPFSLGLTRGTGLRRDDREREIRGRLFRDLGTEDVRLGLDPVVWVGERGEARAAFAVVVSAPGVGYFRRYYVDEHDGRVLQELPAARGAETQNKVYGIDPDAGAPELVLLTGLDGLDALKSPGFHVQRREPAGKAFTQVDIDPDAKIYADDGGFRTAPGDYDKFCQGNSDECPNQAFDGVHVYYHLSNYRDRLSQLLTEMGAGTSLLRNDPLPVFVNGLFDLNGDGVVDNNNALYIPSGCTHIGQNSACMVFLHPEKRKESSCGAGDIEFFHFAREAVVVVHEYQHYVTDMIAGLLSSTEAVVVTDLLHEGYSDYFGASEVSRLAGTPVTNVGRHTLKNCARLQREIGNVLPYDDTLGDANTAPDGLADPHYFGIHWASGLWQLRKELGVDAVDRIALRSLFFLPEVPSHFDAVEALVKADRELFAGANVSRIRDLYYNEIKFLGGRAPPFDPQTKLLNVGFSSCLAVPARPASPGATGLLWLLWAAGTWLAGCLLRRRP